MRATVLSPEARMTYSFTQISQYLRCPRQYCYRYLDGSRKGRQGFHDFRQIL
jgi:hypothetical protein